MTPDARTSTNTEAPALSTEDLKQQVRRIRDSALDDVKRARDEVVQSDQARLAGIVAGVVVVGLSFAYLVGSRRGRSAERLEWQRRRELERDRALATLHALEDLAER